MSRISFQRIATAALFCLFASLPAFSDSQVRIVRLSYVDGTVQIDRGQGYEKAFVNLPIAQDTKLRVTDSSRAEVEFEDGSTIRMVPNTTVQFTQLSLRDSGAKVSALEVKQGTLYVDFAGSKNEELTLQFGQEKVMLAHSAHLRIGVGDTDAALAVFKGDVQVESPSGTVDVRKNQTANFDFLADDRYSLAKNIQQEPYDAWDKQQDEYHLRNASNSYSSYSPYAYGASDLGYYGNFFTAPGYGMMWQPYFAGAGWDPFMDGMWAFSPGRGFGWVSAYPWGWTPYHYGTWVFLPGYGWAWQPGGVWTTWYAQPRLLNAPRGFAVPQAPTTGTTTVIVNRGPMPLLSNQSGSKLVIRNNSAGLGVPRGAINNLAKVSQQVQEHGSVTERAHSPSVAEMHSSAANGGSSSRASAAAQVSAPAVRSSASSSSHAGGGPHH